MPATPLALDQLFDRANEMYWTSDRTVDEIVRELGIGRSSFYTSIHPLVTAASCPSCGDRLAYTTRSNRESRRATCQECGMELIIEDPNSLMAGAEAGRPGSDAAAERQAGWREELGAVSPGRLARVGSAAALGLVMGMAAGRAARDIRR